MEDCVAIVGSTLLPLSDDMVLVSDRVDLIVNVVVNSEVLVGNAEIPSVLVKGFPYT